MDVNALISAIHTHRTAKTTAGSLFGEASGSLEQAYAVQTEMARRKAAEGDPIVGYKLGLLSPDKQKQMGVSEPIIGHVHRSMLINPGVDVRRQRFIQPRVEPELAVVFQRAVPGQHRRGELVGAIAYVLLVIDVLDSIYAGYKFGAADVIADNASSGAVIVGSKPLPTEVLWSSADRRLRMSVEAGTWHEGLLDNLGDPLHWIGWAVDNAARLGRGVQPGDILLLGAPCAAVALPPDEQQVHPLIAEGPERSTIVTRVT